MTTKLSEPLSDLARVVLTYAEENGGIGNPLVLRDELELTGQEVIDALKELASRGLIPSPWVQ